MVAPHEKSEQADSEDRKHHRAIAKHGFTREGRENVRRRAHARKNRDVNLRVTEEPEEVLPKNRRAAGVQREVWVSAGKKSADVKTAGNEEACSSDPIEQ